MQFCPWCGLLLRTEVARSDRLWCLSCPVCPYYCVPEREIVREVLTVKKEIEPVFSGPDAMKFAPKTKGTCPKCRHGEAYFRQLQIRAADEAMSTFYKCRNDDCGHQWRED